jgi:hypothetical protein
MSKYIVSKYNSLMLRLETLPNEIAQAESDERKFIDSKGGWTKDLGSNDTARKLAVDSATAGRASALRQELSATKHAAGLHGDMLRFIASNGWSEEYNQLGADEAMAEVEASMDSVDGPSFGSIVSDTSQAGALSNFGI